MATIAAWKYFKHQTEWKAYLQDLVSHNDTALARAIVLIDNYQTEPERQAKESTEDNDVGWTKQDAKDMGEIADKVRNGIPLSKGELAKSRNKMKKYWRQLMLISQQQQERHHQQELAEIKEQEEQTRLQRERQFREYNKVLYECAENGKQCECGICDECPVTRGLQMRLQLGDTNEE